VDYFGFFIGWTVRFFFGFFGFLRIGSGFLRFGFFGFLRIRFFGFFKDLIIRALQQYKDAKPFRLPIRYSTGQVKASIFGIKSPINGFFACFKPP
jgi:hypothetical protein